MGRVLKAASEHRIPAGVVDAEMRAAEIVRNAEAEAIRIVAQAKAEAATIEEAARVVVVGTLHDLARACTEERAALIRDQPRQLGELALAVGAKLAGRAMADDPAALDSVIRDAITKLPRAVRVCVRVHPDDVARAASAWPAFEFAPDGGLERGECIVESDVGRIDARLSVRLASLTEVLGLTGTGDPL